MSIYYLLHRGLLDNNKSRLGHFECLHLVYKGTFGSGKYRNIILGSNLRPTVSQSYALTARPKWIMSGGVYTNKNMIFAILT